MNATVPTDSPWLNAAQAAAYLGVSIKVIYRGVRTGRLRHVSVDSRGTLRLHKDWLDEFFIAKAS